MKNYYTRYFDSNEGPLGSWIIVYGFGIDERDAFIGGLHKSDVQPKGGSADGTWKAAQELVDNLNEKA